MGRPALNEGEHRKQINVRLKPATIAFLESLQQRNLGRAIDHCADVTKYALKAPAPKQK